MKERWFGCMEKVLLGVAVFFLGLDAISNVILLRYYPEWEKTKRKEVRELKRQNEELRVFLKELLREKGY